jgi:glucan phosphorylase
MGNLGLTDVFKRSLYELGVKMEELYDEEHDAGLGNGGLGRLAACFLDSMATMNYPGWGYGLRYNYGMFEQKIKNGYQVELPDYWLIAGNPWEIERNDVMYTVRMYGQVSETSVPVTHRAATPLDALDELDNKVRLGTTYSLSYTSWLPLFFPAENYCFSGLRVGRCCSPHLYIFFSK